MEEQGALKYEFIDFNDTKGIEIVKHSFLNFNVFCSRKRKKNDQEFRYLHSTPSTFNTFL